MPGRGARVPARINLGKTVAPAVSRGRAPDADLLSNSGSRSLCLRFMPLRSPSTPPLELCLFLGYVDGEFILNFPSLSTRPLATFAITCLDTIYVKAFWNKNSICFVYKRRRLLKILKPSTRFFPWNGLLLCFDETTILKAMSVILYIRSIDVLVSIIPILHISFELAMHIITEGRCRIHFGTNRKFLLWTRCLPLKLDTS